MMSLQTALELQKKISNKFLFSRQNQFVLADSYDEEPATDEMIYDIFEDVFGVSIAGNEATGYYIILLTVNDSLYISPIIRHFNVSRKDIISLVTAPFELRHRIRPLEMGCSVSHRLNNLKGTLGALVKGLSDNQTYILSNHHVLYNGMDKDDNFVVQPCTPDGGTANDAIGLYHRSLAFDHSAINEHDAAIAGPVSVEVDWEIPGMNKHISGVTDAINDHSVYKIGAMTGITYGKIASFLTDVRVRIDGELYDFANQIFIKGIDKDSGELRPFSHPGDSGSLIIDNNTHKAVGLLFAGNSSGDTLANPIGPVLTKLNIGFQVPEK